MDHIPRMYYATVEKLRKEIILLIISEATHQAGRTSLADVVLLFLH